MNYQKGAAWASKSLPYRGDQWYPWLDNTDVIDVDPGDNSGTYPSPMLTDIDFSDRGDLIMSFTDRGGDVWGDRNFQHLAVSTTGIRYVIGGDLLIAGIDCSSGNFTLENNGSFTSSGTTFSSTGGVGNNQGPGGGEFLYRENVTGDHDETAMGSVSNLYGSGQVLASVMDPLRT
ncbi:MAG: hypothetical protein ACK4NS_12135, partial [Saprospiraceae bacterium]